MRHAFRRHLSALVAVGIALALSACGGSSDGTGTTSPPPPPSSPSGTTITSTGGTVGSSDGHATLTFPAGAVTTPLAVTATASTDVPSVSQLVAGTAYDFGPTGSQFATPVTIKLTYLPSQLPSGVNAAFLGLYTRVGSTWQAMTGSVVDTNAHTITGTTTHFSGFTGCGSPCSATDAGVTASFGQDSFVVVSPGGSVLWPGGVEQANYTGNTTVSFPDLPAGLTAVVTFTGVVNGSCQVNCYKPTLLNLTAAASVAAGMYSATIHPVGDAGATSHDTKMQIEVIATPGFSVSPSGPTVSLAQGASVNTNIAVNRTRFTGTVTLTARGLPGGVSASFNPATVADPATTSVMTLTATGAAVAGTYPVTIAGNAPGSTEHDALVTLTVSNFTIVGTPPTITVAPGATASTGIKATRGAGFVGTITYAVASVTGITGLVTPTSVTDSSSLALTVASNVAPGSYQATVTGTNAGKSQQATIAVTVAAASSNRLDFSQCPATSKPIWLAYQDGNGPWTRLTGNSDVYTIPTLAAGVGGIALVDQFGALFGTGVTYAAQAEFASFVNCLAAPAGVTVTGSTTDFGTGNADIAIGGAFNAAGPASSFQLTGVASGTQDLIAYLQRDLFLVTPATDRFLFKRDLSITNGGTVGFLDFTGNGSFAPDTATVSVVGTDAPLLQGMSFFTNSCTGGGGLYTQNGVGSSFIVTGVPAAQQRTGDLQAIGITDGLGSSLRFVTTYFHTLTHMTLTLAAPLAPTITTLPGSYLRLQAAVATTDYPYLQLEYNAGNSNVGIVQTAAYRSAMGGAVAMPDLFGVSGFSTAWEAPTGTVASYQLEGNSYIRFAPPCGVGTTRGASVMGNH